MKHIQVRNVAQALAEGVWHMRTLGPECHGDSRNGRVIVSPGPVLTEYEYPMERVLWAPIRDANPVFHLMEAIWMLAGRCDVYSLLPFNSTFDQYAEDDGVVHGAYGHRWRNKFGHDQIKRLVKHLSETPNSRRAVMQMWSAEHDLDVNVRDVPCNTHIYLQITDHGLEMTVCCRSNDMVWGAYGANAVHFSVLQELIASALELPMGPYRQFSNNFHVYPDLPVVQRLLDSPFSLYDGDRYDSGEYFWHPLLGTGERWEDVLHDAEVLFVGGDLKTAFFRDVALPLLKLYLRRKGGDKSARASGALATVDWGAAFNEWCNRRDA